MIMQNDDFNFDSCPTVFSSPADSMEHGESDNLPQDWRFRFVPLMPEVRQLRPDQAYRDLSGHHLHKPISLGTSVPEECFGHTLYFG